MPDLWGFARGVPVAVLVTPLLGPAPSVICPVIVQLMLRRLLRALSPHFGPLGRFLNLPSSPLNFRLLSSSVPDPDD